MTENFTYKSDDDVLLKVCPFSRFFVNKNNSFCAGENCMAFIREVDDLGKATGRGRCGMVQQIATICNCV